VVEADIFSTFFEWQNPVFTHLLLIINAFNLIDGLTGIIEIISSLFYAFCIIKALAFFSTKQNLKNFFFKNTVFICYILLFLRVYKRFVLM
jgi:UDP-N-acetylmuramyl pentapeptide phosphotransferase/UDP-N-acetylglucosamine-1-phosphate transferase